MDGLTEGGARPPPMAKIVRGGLREYIGNHEFKSINSELRCNPKNLPHPAHWSQRIHRWTPPAVVGARGLPITLSG